MTMIHEAASQSEAETDILGYVRVKRIFPAYYF